MRDKTVKQTDEIDTLEINKALKRKPIIKYPVYYKASKYCGVFDTLEYMAFGFLPISADNCTFCFLALPTCSLRQALEKIAFNWEPTNKNGEKFLHHVVDYLNKSNDSKSLQQLEKLKQAKDCLEVLIQEQKLSIVEYGEKINFENLHRDYEEGIHFESLKSHFQIIYAQKNTLGQMEYFKDVIFKTEDVEKAYKEYATPEYPSHTFSLSLKGTNLYLQKDTEDPEKIKSFNKHCKQPSSVFIILKQILDRPNKPIELKDLQDPYSKFGNTNFHKALDSTLKSLDKNNKYNLDISKKFFSVQNKKIRFTNPISTNAL